VEILKTAKMAREILDSFEMTRSRISMIGRISFKHAARRRNGLSRITIPRASL
jgi:hypothetical protein